jgi:hypothetical protein
VWRPRGVRDTRVEHTKKKRRKNRHSHPRPSPSKTIKTLSPPQILKRVGELFPKGAKATRAYLHKEEDVEAALK